MKIKCRADLDVLGVKPDGWAVPFTAPGIVGRLVFVKASSGWPGWVIYYTGEPRRSGGTATQKFHNALIKKFTGHWYLGNDCDFRNFYTDDKKLVLELGSETLEGL